MMVFLKLMARAYPLQKKHLCRQVLAIAFQILKRMKRMREGVQVRKLNHLQPVRVVKKNARAPVLD